MSDASGHQNAKTQRASELYDGRYASLVYSAIGISLLIVLVADFFTPLGVAVWIFHLVPVTMSLLLKSPRIPMLIAAVCTVLMTFTLATDAAGVSREVAVVNRVFGIVTIWVMALVGTFFIKNKGLVQRQQWIQSGRTGLGMVMSGEQATEKFGENTIRFICEILDAQAAALFVEDGDEFKRIATYGLSSSKPMVERFTRRDGLLGQTVKDGRTFCLSNVPDNYLTIESSLGHGKPRHLVIAPMKVEGDVNAVIELGFMRRVGDEVDEFLEAISEPVGVAVRSARYRFHLQKLLQETRQQAEELQQQSEELRVANEEMEVQSRVLQESQSRLEQQKVELEQTNAQLEDQAQLLEAQRDDLAKARVATEAKARELEQASRYKSDFLANMSHELRTPLNSSLILSKLLADNPEGNLTKEQVTSAETIHASGNDLLCLINDILDLSKIEAGKMEVRADNVWLPDMVRELENSISPLATQKGLQFRTEIIGDFSEPVFTDRQRLDQVLKNLLSNAIKFTDKGNVGLTIRNHSENEFAIEISDTGIGIPEQEQQAIFEAFRQVDSAANRRYSGTGLGLSITKELVRILGGQIQLASRVGEGSRFTIVLPRAFKAASTTSPKVSTSPIFRDNASLVSQFPKQQESTNSTPQNLASAPKPIYSQPRSFKDDRGQLSGDSRLILIVEDDESFAKILADLAHELRFQCVVATTAEEAMALAAQFMPHAIVLDIGLPDESGLLVLDRVKQDSRTRHIPVHVISANDLSETAIALGAVGFAVKPVDRATLVETLKGIETKLNQRTRRVLVVEDDAVQLESLQKLLGSHEVQTEGVRSVAECLEQLKNNTYDCMVLDLSLPDASGYSLLETLSRDDSYSFPPVIVYTGRDLSAQEEQRLRMFSKSIIIKGAKSPERLLDEVTLFLHQVVSELPAEQQKMIRKARSREAALEGRRILIVEDDVRNIFALSSLLEPRGVVIQISRNGKEALTALEESLIDESMRIDLVLMDVMMPEMDGLTATQEIRKRQEFRDLPIIMLTAKAMKDDQENCIAAGANDYMAKPLDVDKLLSLVRVWIRKR